MTDLWSVAAYYEVVPDVLCSTAALTQLGTDGRAVAPLLA